MKKIFLIALAVAGPFTLPLTAQAKTEFELGGYIRLDAMWNTQQNMSHALTSYCQRDNIQNANHGRFLMNANASRFNFTIKGPELWGGKVTGFMEMDFDGQDTTVNLNNGRAVADSSFGQAKLRLRHAMFKINWSEQELLFGQYWSINSELIPDTADSGGYALYGATQLRIPQIRYTQKFGNGFDASIAIEDPQNGRWGLNLDNLNALEGETGETPMVELKARYEQDLYGKAGWYGKPRAFYVGLGAGYSRSRNLGGSFVNTATVSNWNTLGQGNFFPALGAGNTLNINNANYHDHWLFLIENFTPIIPTTTKSLAGTMSLAHQWWIGQGVSAWRLDLPGNDRFYNFNGTFVNATSPNYDMTFIKRYGGWAQLQYYWKEEIYTNLNFGFENAFGGLNQATNASLTNLAGIFAGQPGFAYANPVGFDPVRSQWRAGITQWYRPVSAVKFGLQYTFMQTNYFQYTSNGTFANPGTDSTNKGVNHSLMANAWYFF